MKKNRGFTLLEVLVAMTILAIIILIVGGIFNQSRTAWEAGTRKTELNMEGRAALTLISMELGQAVADRAFFTNILPASGSDLRFFTFGSATNGERVARCIRYNLSGETLLRQVGTVRPNNPGYPANLDWGGGPVTLAENVESLSFKMSDNQMHTTNLPAWVDVELSLRKGSKYSLIRVSSAGPDGVHGNADDVKSWDSKL